MFRLLAVFKQTYFQVATVLAAARTSRSRPCAGEGPALFSAFTHKHPLGSLSLPFRSPPC